MAALKSLSYDFNICFILVFSSVDCLSFSRGKNSLCLHMTSDFLLCLAILVTVLWGSVSYLSNLFQQLSFDIISVGKGGITSLLPTGSGSHVPHLATVDSPEEDTLLLLVGVGIRAPRWASPTPPWLGGWGISHSHSCRGPHWHCERGSGEREIISLGKRWYFCCPLHVQWPPLVGGSFLQPHQGGILGSPLCLCCWGRGTGTVLSMEFG